MKETDRCIGYSMKCEGQVWGNFIFFDAMSDMNGICLKCVEVVNGSLDQIARTIEHEHPEKLELIEVLKSIKFKYQDPRILAEFDTEGNCKP